MTSLELLVKLATVWNSNHVGVPFMPLFRRESGRWSYWCPNLSREGRCLDYENRPVTCRIFEPASDPLCVHYNGAEGVDNAPK